MNRRLALRGIGPATALLSLSILACLASGSAAPTGAPLASPGSTHPAGGIATELATTSAPDTVTAVPAASSASSAAVQPNFNMAVLVDVHSEPVGRDQAQALINEAGKFLGQLTPFGLEMTNYHEDSSGGTATEMLQRYMASHAAGLPNGILLFSFGDGGQAKLYGGYSFVLPEPAGYRNAFASPVVGDAQIYVAVVHFSHKYAACGYGGSDIAASSTALDGECRNQPGTACVQQNGYSMCANAVGTLYMSTPTYFAASTVVHELLHPFAPGGDKDHYATPECNAQMGYPAGFFDLQESQYYNGLCPFVYENFKTSYRP